MKTLFAILLSLMLVGCAGSGPRDAGYTPDGRKAYYTTCPAYGYQECLAIAGQVCKEKGFDEIYIGRHYNSFDPNSLTFACR